MTKDLYSRENKQHPQSAAGGSCEVAFRKWAELRRSAGDLNNPTSPWHAFELDLEHELSYLAGLAEKVFQKCTTIDYQTTASAELADLEKLVRRLKQLPAPPDRKQVYSRLIAATQDLVNAMGAIPVSEEGHLGFRGAVKKEFKFLEEEYGFRIHHTTPVRVAYRSPNMDLELHYSPKVPETTFRIGPSVRNEDLRKWFYIDDLLYASSQQLPPDYSRFDLEAKGGVESMLWETAALVREHGGPFLRGDASAIQLLAEKAEERDRRRSEQLDRLDNTERG